MEGGRNDDRMEIEAFIEDNCLFVCGNGKLGFKLLGILISISEEERLEC